MATSAAGEDLVLALALALRKLLAVSEFHDLSSKWGLVIWDHCMRVLRAALDTPENYFDPGVFTSHIFPHKSIDFSTFIRVYFPCKVRGWQRKRIRISIEIDIRVVCRS